MPIRVTSYCATMQGRGPARATARAQKCVLLALAGCLGLCMQAAAKKCGLRSLGKLPMPAA